MKFNLTLIFGLFLNLGSFGQSSTLKITVLNKVTSQVVGDKEMILTINDTLTKILKLDADGQAGAIRINGGYYKLQIQIDQYEVQTLKKVGIDDPRGRILIVKMNPLNHKSK